MSETRAPMALKIPAPIFAKLHIDSTLDSSHWLPHVDATHRCANPHGHTFSVRIFVDGVVDDQERSRTKGMVVDYDRILEYWMPLHEILDHCFLNNVKGLENPTCENIAVWILERMPDWISAVEIGTGLVGGMRAGCRIDRKALATAGVR